MFIQGLWTARACVQRLLVSHRRVGHHWKRVVPSQEDPQQAHNTRKRLSARAPSQQARQLQSSNNGKPLQCLVSSAVSALLLLVSSCLVSGLQGPNHDAAGVIVVSELFHRPSPLSFPELMFRRHYIMPVSDRFADLSDVSGTI